MLTDFIQSGILERYCLGQASNEDRLMVDIMAYQYPEVEAELKAIKYLQNAQDSVKDNSLSKVKHLLMREVYASSAKENKTYLPLIDKVNSRSIFHDFLQNNTLQRPAGINENIYAIPLPSTREIQNAAVWVKEIFPEELHTGENEYIYVVDGSCTMLLNGTAFKHKTGDTIFIPPFVTHSATITSSEPMFALVQRQTLPNVAF